METVYFFFIVFLFALAVFDLTVGVSNDAVNFLNSAIGSKAASFKTILIIASVGVFVGAVMSNGMMDIARHGIFQPQMFSFRELLCIFLAVMVTDVVLLDVFNTFGMPTSTTVSMVFELLGGTFVLSLLKIVSDSTGTLDFAALLNTDKALSVIMGIFLSVAVAFVVGTIVQWLARLVFTFDYPARMKWFAGVFGGIAVTAILYFALLKGLKNSAVMTAEMAEWLERNTSSCILVSLVAGTIVMQMLHFCKVNVFKIVIFMGTFALAMAFAGNDLVNFIGVPLAAFSSYQDFCANGMGNADTFMMSSLNESAKTPFVFLFASGVIMIYALGTSKKAQNVVNTSVGLSRQDEGDEMFGSSRVARSIVRMADSVGEWLSGYTPACVKRYVDARFDKEKIILANGAAFDMVRASVNLVIASLLIALGTSLKLPLSTTYVTFIVAMGTSLADKAWSRESAVFRITGVLNVVGGWFLTAGIAFSACATVTVAMYYGGYIAMALAVFAAIFILIKNNLPSRQKEEQCVPDTLFGKIMATKDKDECWALLKKHVAFRQQEQLHFIMEIYETVVDGFVDEDLKKLRQAAKRLDSEKVRQKRLRRHELIGMRKMSKEISLEKSTWLHLTFNSGEQMMYCLKRMAEPCKEHVDNHFNPLPPKYEEEIKHLKSDMADFMLRGEQITEERDDDGFNGFTDDLERYRQKISAMRNVQEHRIQTDDTQSMRVSLVYLNLLQETQELLGCMRRYMRAYRYIRS